MLAAELKQLNDNIIITDTAYAKNVVLDCVLFWRINGDKMSIKERVLMQSALFDEETLSIANEYKFDVHPHYIPDGGYLNNTYNNKKKALLIKVVDLYKSRCEPKVVNIVDKMPVQTRELEVVPLHRDSNRCNSIKEYFFKHIDKKEISKDELMNYFGYSEWEFGMAIRQFKNDYGEDAIKCHRHRGQGKGSCGYSYRPQLDKTNRIL
jgi:hypothetical protein